MAIPVGIAGGLALFFPPEGAGAFWLAASYATLTLGWSMIALPWQAWGAELSPDYAERTRIVSWREGLTLVGIILSALLPALLHITEPAAVLHFLASLCVVAALPTLAVLLLVVRETPMISLSEPSGMRLALRTAWDNRAFRNLLAAWTLNGIANGLPAVLFLLLCKYLLDAADQAGPLLLAFFATGIICLPFWSWLANRIGKHRAWCAAMIWTCAAFLPVLWLGPGDATWFALVCLGTGAGLGADLVLPPAMQADVVDLDTLNHGEARAGLFFAAWTMAQKAGAALSAGLAFGLLDIVGFHAEGENGKLQIMALAGLYCLLPVILKLIAIALVWRFPIDRTEQARIRAALLARTAAA
jgi:Na+/melibiose symporter-like transporter